MHTVKFPYNCWASACHKLESDLTKFTAKRTRGKSEINLLYITYSDK